MPGEPEFDWSQAESLLGEDPNNVPPDMAEIVTELVQGSSQRFQELKQFNPATDRVKISSAAHQLRGSLLNFGFVGVGELLYDIEKKKQYTEAEYPGMVDQAATAFQDSLKLVSGRYPTLTLS